MSEQPPYEPYEPYPEDSARRETEGYGEQPTPAERPPSIRAAVLLMRIGAALSALYLVVTLLTLGSLKDDLRDQLAKQNKTFTQTDLDNAYTAALVVTIFIGLVGVALWLWMAAKNGNGKKWARAVATVLAAFNILLSAGSLLGASGGNSTPVALVYTAANLAIAVSALVFMYRRDASRYYASMSRRVPME